MESAALDKYGRLVIPAHLRKEMGWKPGDRLSLAIGDNELRVLSRRQALERLREEIRKHVPPEISLADELIRERRKEVKREEQDLPKRQPKQKPSRLRSA